MNAKEAIRLAGLLGVIGLVLGAVPVRAEDEKTFTIADGAVELPVPAGWQRKEPRYRIIEHEFEVAPAEKDENPGRVTVTGATGSIEDNINRWAGQFSQPDDSNSRDKMKIERKTIAGQDVTLVDISGTYDDKPGPFAPGRGVQRENYRMLAAIIQTKKDGKSTGNYFIKFYGPNATVSGQQANFTKMIEGLKAK